MSAQISSLLRSGARCDRSGALWQTMLAFHNANPHVYKRLREICDDLRRTGWSHYSMRTLVCVLRFEADLASRGEEVRIDGAARKVALNDHHSVYYARMLIEEDPSYADFFELRAAEGDPMPASVTKSCAHADATIRNCPYHGDVYNDASQRCRCCDSCAHECGMDI